MRFFRSIFEVSPIIARLPRIALLQLLLVMAFGLTGCGEANESVSEQLSLVEQPVAPDFAGHLEDTQKIEGFYTLYWAPEKGSLYLQVDSFDVPFLYVNGLSRGLGSNDLGLDRGQLGQTRLVSFVDAGPRVLLLEDNTTYLAKSTNADEEEAVEDSFGHSVLWGFSVLAREDGSVLLDATEFFLRDAHGVAARLKAKGEGDFKAEPSRSMIFMDRTRGFPDNTEVDALVTLVGEATGEILPTVVPDQNAPSMHQHHSFVRLPDAGYQAIPYDPRSGYIDAPDTAFFDYAVPVGEQVIGAHTWRHRLRKKDPSAERSEAVEPIVYYVDRGVPEPIRSALVEGVSWWSQAFEAAGYIDGYRVELLPPGVDPMDVRYNVIQWVHRSTRGWSYGSSVRDPRTGEIIKGHVSLGSLRVRQDYLLAEGFLSPYQDEAVPDQLLEFSLARIRQLAAHEVGHTLGLEHNFAGSNGNRASVMDYPYPLVSLQEDGSIDISQAYGVGLGAWDIRAIMYGYEDFPAEVDAEAARLGLLEDTYRSGLEFVADTHARNDSFARSAGPAHPRGSLWDNGESAVAELRRLMALRQVVLARFSQNNIRIGRPMASIEDVLVPMYLMHRYQLQAAATVIGGQEFTYALRGDDQVPVKKLPVAQQQDALDALLETVRPEALRLHADLVALIPPRPPGSVVSRELFPRHTGYVFDPLAAAAAAAGLTMDMLLDPTRAARMNNNYALDSSQPDFISLVSQVLKATWMAPHSMPADASLQRVVNTEVLKRLLALVKNSDAQPQVRAVALDQLLELKSYLQQKIAIATPSWRAHYRLAMVHISELTVSPLDSGTLSVPPGSPI